MLFRNVVILDTGISFHLFSSCLEQMQVDIMLIVNNTVSADYKYCIVKT